MSINITSVIVCNSFVAKQSWVDGMMAKSVDRLGPWTKVC